MVCRILIAAFFLSFYSNIFAQTDSVATNGFKTFYYQNGNKSSEGNFVNGKPEGLWKSYFENGKLKSEGNRHNNKPDGLWKFYNENGKIASELIYDLGLKNGIQRYYFSDGKLKQEEELKDGIRQGWVKDFGENGQLINMVPFKNGVEDGIAKSYADDGRLITITTYNEGYIRSEARINRIDKFGLKQGVWKVFFDNDKLKEETEYLDDKRNGFYRVYNSDGTLALSEKYKNGELVIDKKSTTKFEVKRNFYTGGKVKSIVNVINDKRQGVEKIYDEKGNVISGKLFEDDKPVAEGITDENGNRQGEWKFFYEDGTVYSIGKYKDGKRIDEWKFLFQNGAVQQIGNYKNGLPEGEWKWYFRNGEIRRDESFINGKEEGISKEYNDSLQLIATGKYVDGKKEGLWKYNNGEYVAEGEYADGLAHGIRLIKTAKQHLQESILMVLKMANMFITTTMGNYMKCVTTNKVNGMDYGRYMMIKVF